MRAHERNGRRQLLVLLGAGAFAPRVSRAQTKIWRIGFLSARSRSEAVEIPPFLEGMRELGYVEGRNVQYEWRFGGGSYDRLRGLAEELVRLRVDVIAASSTPCVRAAQQSTKQIPIVMVAAVEPVRLGFVASLARPGGNITGVSNLSEATWQKQFDTLLEAVPQASRVAILLNPEEQFSDATYKSVQAAAQQRKITLVPVRASTAEQIERAFVTMKEERIHALLVAGGALFVQNRRRLAEMAARSGIPAIYNRREYPESGGLMSYGRNAAMGYRRAAVYVDKILKGAQPADLPIEQASVIELVINRKAAKALGFAFPPQLLVRADTIID